MSALGADLQSASNELVTIIEQLKEQRADLSRLVVREEEEKARIVAEIRALTERLNRVDESLAKKTASLEDFDRTIQETSNQFARILDTSKLLLSTARRDSVNLGTRMGE